jgi:hypothetical protein
MVTSLLSPDLNTAPSNMNNGIQPADGRLGANMQQLLLHPWKMIDYYLYLTRVVELGRTCETRRDETHLITTDGFQQIDSDDLCIRSTPSTDRVVFTALPVPSSEFPDRKIVLGCDLNTTNLLAHLVDHAPEHLRDLGQVWSRAKLIINIQADRFLETLKNTLNGRLDILRVGMIGYHRESTHELHSALDLVIVIQFCQFLSDCAELLGIGKKQIVDLRRYDEQMRDLLQKASTEAWFGARDGLSIEEYRRREMNRPVSFDLFESKGVPSTPSLNLFSIFKSPRCFKSRFLTPHRPRVMDSFTAPATVVSALAIVAMRPLIG